MADPERGFVVRPRVRRSAGAVVLGELLEQRRRVLDEVRVACHDVALAEVAERPVGDFGLDRAERAPERDQLPITEPTVGADEAGRELPGLHEQSATDRVGVGALGLGPPQHDGLQALDELADRPGQDVVAAPVVHHPAIIVARAASGLRFVLAGSAEREQQILVQLHPDGVVRVDARRREPLVLAFVDPRAARARRRRGYASNRATSRATRRTTGAVRSSRVRSRSTTAQS